MTGSRGRSAAARAPGWGGASAVGYRRISGSRSITLSPEESSSALLLVPTCAASSRTFLWYVGDAAGDTVASKGSTCGRLVAQSIRVEGHPLPLTADIDVNGASRYALTVYEH